MSRRKLIVCMAVFNALMIVAFVLSNIYFWDFLNTQINFQGGYGNGEFIVPRIQINGLQVTVGVDGWMSDGTPIPTTAPISVPNYPFFAFWVAIVGNFVLIALVLRKSDKQEQPQI